MTKEKKIGNATKRRLDMSKKIDTSKNGKLVVVAQELVTTTYTREEREMIRMLHGPALHKMTGIERYTVQRFIEGKPMNKDTVQEFSRIIEILKQL